MEKIVKSEGEKESELIFDEESVQMYPFYDPALMN